MAINRRGFFNAVSSILLASTLAPTVARAQTASAHVIVAGGGFSGATVAKYLKKWGGSSLRVTLVDPNPAHTSCIMSGLVLDGHLQLSDLQFNLSALSAHGVEYVEDWVDGVDAAAGRVQLRNGGSVAYDRLVLTGGIDFKPLTGWDPAKLPHAWIAGDQTTLLRDQIAAMPDDGTFVMTIPKSPYRCPPGPYERACTIAHILSSRSALAKVIVLDENDQIQASRNTFTSAFNDTYFNVIDYRPGSMINEVDSDAKSVVTSTGAVTGDVVNIIANQQASALVRNAGLVAAGSDWAAVDPLSYESTLAGFEGVYVLGDSQSTGQPKSGHMANAQAKICADAIIRQLNGEAVDTAERMANIVTNSACYSPITGTESSWLTAVFAYDQANGNMMLRPDSLAESGDWTAGNYRDMFTWSEILWADTFT